MKIIAIAAMLAAANVSAAPLPQCDLAGTTGIRDFKASPQLLPQAGHFRKLTNVTMRASSQPISKGEPVLVADVEVVQRTVLLKATAPFRYSANILAIGFSFDPSIPQASVYKFRARNNEIYHLLLYPKDAVFVREDGVPCDRVARYSRDSSAIVAYTYKTDPEDARFTFDQADDSWGVASLRLIFMGTSAGAIQFQEVWARDGRILSSRLHQFDQFAKTVKIAGFGLTVDAATPDTAVLAVDTPDEMPLSMEEAKVLSSTFKR